MDETLVHNPPKARRLNPFAFPAETDVRFNLLVVSVIMLSMDISALVLPLTNTATGAQSLGAAGLAARFSAITGETLEESARILDVVTPLASAVSYCTVMGFFLALLAVTTQIIYRSHPASIRRARKLVPLSPQKDPRLAGEIAALAEKAQVPVPAVEIGSGSGAADGQVFGAGRSTVMRLGGGMKLLLRKAPDIFRATVLHELAHIANGDVQRAYLSQSLWVSTVAVIFVPLSLFYTIVYASNAFDVVAGLATGTPLNLKGLLESTLTYLWFMLQVSCLLGLYGIIRASLLRAREIYADWRAALWGAADGLTTIFERSRDTGRRRWLGLWQLHPAPGERLRFLQNPRRLFSIPADVPFMVGALFGAAMSGVVLVSTALGLGFAGSALFVGELMDNFGPSGALTGDVLAVIGFIAFLVLFIVPQWLMSSATAQSFGLDVQREAVASLALNERRGVSAYLTLLGPSILFAVGLEMGMLITPVSFYVDIPALITFQSLGFIETLTIAILSVVWIAAVALIIWLWLTWGWRMSQRLLGAHAGDKPPDSRRKFVAWWLTLLLWLVLMPLMLLQSAIWGETATNALLTPELSLLIAFLGLGAAVMTAGAGWLIIELRRAVGITCPACHHKSKQRHAVGRNCEHCGADLAPWIWVT
jgi:hypothetical protein